MTPSFSVPVALGDAMNHWQRPALAAGVILSGVSIIGAFFNPGEFFHSYLMGYLFWVGLALGSMALVMVQYLTGGAWGVMTRRASESASRTLPFLAVMFIPLAIGIPYLYDWAHPDRVRGDNILMHRSVYMNTPLFIVRAAAYFAIWIALAYFLNKWSQRQDERGDRFVWLTRISAPGLILYVFTMTFAVVDWAESLENHFYSTMWGFIFVADQGISAMCFAILCLVLLSRWEPLASAFHTRQLHDLGKLLLMFVMLWAYFVFSQLLIIWSGNLTDEIPWFLPRLATSWGWVGGALIVFQFIIPFLMLLSRSLKRSAVGLSIVVGLLILMRWVDLFWTVMPSSYRAGFTIHWLNFTVPLALGGFWVALFLRFLKQRPLLPVGAPDLEQAIHHGEH